jgi:aspartyl-tRNA(Asn)/glutamyl-tRNA(Gln) amidotransferase subunit A
MSESLVTTVTSTLDAITRANGKLHAFVKITAASAMAEAQRLQNEPAGSAEHELLRGMPIAVKDIIDVAGEVTGCGSLTRKGAAPASQDAHVVAKLRTAGAVIVGKTHTVEYALGGYGTNVTIGTPHNPWDLSVHRVPGGSSSGSGVAVGAGLVPAALGTDTGGSVRIPAALCGCVGLKTSIGLIGRSGVAPLSSRLDTIGPLAKDVRTAALMFAAMVGRDPKDHTTEHDRHPGVADILGRLEDGITGLRLAHLEEQELPLMSAEVKADYEAALRTLEKAGAKIATCKMPEPLQRYQSRVGSLAAIEGYGLYRDFVEDPQSGLAEPIRQRMLTGKAVTPAQLEEIDAQRRKDITSSQAMFDGFDAIVLPTVPFPAMPVTEVDETQSAYAAHTRWVNYLELAGLAVPTTLSRSGLPLSLQIVVRRFDDPLALRIGRAFETARGPFPRPANIA